MSNLTVQDIDDLIDSVEAWEKEPSSNALTGSILGAVLVGMSKSDESKDKFEADDSDKQAKAKIETDRRKRRAIFLKAKLMELRDEALIAEATSKQ